MIKCHDNRMRPHLQKVLDGEYDIELDAPPSTVLDLGANVGAFALWAREKWPQARITCYEPHLKNFADLQTNAPFADLNQAAVTAMKKHRAGFREGENNCGEGYVSGLGQTSVSNVNASTLPSFEFVKLDIEGFESSTLACLDLSQTKTVALEYHSELIRQECFDYLQPKGFTLARWDPTGPEHGIAIFKRDYAPKLMIGIPIYRKADPFFLQSVAVLQHEIKQHNLPWKLVNMAGDAAICRSRNTITGQFLRSDCDYLLQIDDDLIFGVDHIQSLLDKRMDLVCGLYPKRQDGPVAWVINGLPGGIEGPEGLLEVRYAGTGFMMTHRRVFMRMIEAGVAPKYRQDSSQLHDWHFWRFEVVKGRLLSEDWFFCDLARDLGIKTWVDRAVCLKHVNRQEVVTVYPTPEQEEGMWDGLP